MRLIPLEKTRLLSSDEHESTDGDEHFAFGHFAPNKLQRALAKIASNTFLHRGVFRKRMTMLLRGREGRPLDVTFRECAYRLRNLNNLIENGILLNPGYNAADIDFLIEGVSPGGIFVDIGANIGLYTLPLAKAVGSNGKVVAIDASKLMAQRLAFNASASGIENVEIFPCAVSATEGTGSLRIRKDDVAIVSLDEAVAGSVPIRTLRSILEEAAVERIDALKIDIEGHEELVLAPFIRDSNESVLPRRIVIERPGADDYPDCAAAFKERGYRLVGRSRNNSFYRLG